MAELLFGSYGPDLIAYTQQYPWKVFAVALCGVLLLWTILKPNASRGTGGDLDLDFGGDGGE